MSEKIFGVLGAPDLRCTKCRQAITFAHSKTAVMVRRIDPLRRPHEDPYHAECAPRPDCTSSHQPGRQGMPTVDPRQALSSMVDAVKGLPPAEWVLVAPDGRVWRGSQRDMARVLFRNIDVAALFSDSAPVGLEQHSGAENFNNTSNKGVGPNA